MNFELLEKVLFLDSQGKETKSIQKCTAAHWYALPVAEKEWDSSTPHSSSQESHN